MWIKWDESKRWNQGFINIHDMPHSAWFAQMKIKQCFYKRGENLNLKYKRKITCYKLGSIYKGQTSSGKQKISHAVWWSITKCKELRRTHFTKQMNWQNYYSSKAPIMIIKKLIMYCTAMGIQTRTKHGKILHKSSQNISQYIISAHPKPLEILPHEKKKHVGI